MTAPAPASSSAFALRRATPADVAAILNLSAHIWEGSDYVPGRLDAWLADGVGPFMVAMAGEQLAGFGKLTCLREGEWWLEGLRVHPDFRQRGVARLLHRQAVSLADQLGTGVLRFSTASVTEATRHLAADTGFRLVLRAVPARSPEEPDGEKSENAASAFVPVEPDELVGFSERLGVHQALAAMAGLAFDGWVAREILAALPAYHDQGRLYWWRRRAGMMSLHYDGERLQANFVVVSPADLAAVLEDLGAEANRKVPPTRARVVLPASEDAFSTLTTSGWDFPHDFEIHVFERPLQRTGP